MGNVITSRDYEVIRAMVTETVPQEHLEGFYKTMNKAGNSLHPQRGSTALFDYHTVKNCAIIYNSTQDWADPAVITVNKLIEFSFFLKFRNAAEIYQSLPEVSQKFLLKTDNLEDEEIVYIYLHALNKLHAGPKRNLKDAKTRWDEDSIRFAPLDLFIAFLEEIESTSTFDDAWERFDLTKPDDEVLQWLVSYHPTLLDLGNNSSELILMWRAVYGNTHLVEFLERVCLPDFHLNPIQIVDILDDWEQVRDYPIDWILETRMSP